MGATSRSAASNGKASAKPCSKMLASWALRWRRRQTKGASAAEAGSLPGTATGPDDTKPAAGPLPTDAPPAMSSSVDTLSTVPSATDAPPAATSSTDRLLAGASHADTSFVAIASAASRSADVPAGAFSNLPAELIGMILGRLSMGSGYNLSQTCHHLEAVTLEYYTSQRRRHWPGSPGQNLREALTWRQLVQLLGMSGRMQFLNGLAVARPESHACRRCASLHRVSPEVLQIAGVSDPAAPNHVGRRNSPLYDIGSVHVHLACKYSRLGAGYEGQLQQLLSSHAYVERPAPDRSVSYTVAPRVRSFGRWFMLRESWQITCHTGHIDIPFLLENRVSLPICPHHTLGLVHGNFFSLPSGPLVRIILAARFLDGSMIQQACNRCCTDFAVQYFKSDPTPRQQPDGSWLVTPPSSQLRVTAWKLLGNEDMSTEHPVWQSQVFSPENRGIVAPHSSGVVKSMYECPLAADLGHPMRW